MILEFVLIGIKAGWWVPLAIIGGFIVFSLVSVGLFKLANNGHLSWVRTFFRGLWAAVRFACTALWTLAMAFKYRFCPVSELIDE